MLYFGNPIFLYLLLLVPLIPVVYALMRAGRRRRMRRFGDEALVSALMPSWSSSKGWWRVALFCLGFACFVIGLSRPVTGAKLARHETSGAEIMICLDVSNSMLAKDYSPDRLTRAKLAISRLVDRLQDDRIGLVIFAGSSFVQLPITTDYVSAKMFLGNIDTRSVPVQGTAIGDAIITAARSFSVQSERSRAIIVITDGENHIRVYTVGVGSLRGQPLSVDGQLLKDSNGEIVVSKLDEQTLKDIASAGNGIYVQAGNEEFGLNPIIEQIRSFEDEKFSSIVFEEYDEQYMYFFGAALVFFVIEMLIGRRRFIRRLF